MYLLIQENIDGTLRGHWMKEVKLDGKNGGWISGIKTDGSSLGIPLSQAKSCYKTPIDNDVSDPH